jgi:DNA-binding IclR family transcriptional regulator
MIRIIDYNIIVDVFLSRLGVSMRPSAYRILTLLREQDPKDPWVDIPQIIKKTSLSEQTVYLSLTSLLEAGLVVEYPRQKKIGHRRYFADALKQIEGILPNRTTQRVLDVLTEQKPEVPWVDIQQIIEETGLTYVVVVRCLTSLLELGLVVEYSRTRESSGLIRYFAHASREIEGIEPLNRTTRQVLDVVTGGNPENPWVDIPQIMEKTGLDRRTVVINLTSLLELGLIVEYPRKRVGQQRRNFTNALKQVEGIKPQEKEDLEYVP